MTMLTEVCQYLRNWFTRRPDGGYYPSYEGAFRIENGTIPDLQGKLADGQYFRIIGSIFNDGVHRYGDPADLLADETFCGTVCSMMVPPEVVALADDISEWQAKYGGVDAPAMSPYDSETWGGYTYKMRQGYAGSGGGMMTGWQNVFHERLKLWRKI